MLVDKISTASAWLNPRRFDRKTPDNIVNPDALVAIRLKLYGAK
jgi:hypothetical protein